MTPETQAAIRDSFHKDLPAILAGDDPFTLWDQPPELVPSKETIRAVVCEVAEISLMDILGPGKHRQVSRPRQVICFLIREIRPDIKLHEIGLFLGGRDHTTVIHAIKQVKGLLEIGDDLTMQLYHEAKRRLAAP